VLLSVLIILPLPVPAGESDTGDRIRLTVSLVKPGVLVVAGVPAVPVFPVLAFRPNLDLLLIVCELGVPGTALWVLVHFKLNNRQFFLAEIYFRFQ